MKKRKQISSEEAKLIGESLHIDWEQVDLEQFRQGLMKGAHNAEPAHIYPGVLLTGQVVLTHMQEFPDYFTRLAKLEQEVDAYRVGRRTGVNGSIDG
jgi:hypothetical protein